MEADNIDWIKEGRVLMSLDATKCEVRRSKESALWVPS